MLILRNNFWCKYNFFHGSRIRIRSKLQLIYMAKYVLLQNAPQNIHKIAELQQFQQRTLILSLNVLGITTRKLRRKNNVPINCLQPPDSQLTILDCRLNSTAGSTDIDTLPNTESGLLVHPHRATPVGMSLVFCNLWPINRINR